MRFEHTIRYDATPEEVHAMLADPAFRERVCQEQHASTCTVEIDAAGAGMRVAVDQQRPSRGIPSFAQKFVGDTIHITQREQWSTATDASLDVGIPGKPGHLKGTVTLRPDGDGTVETVAGELKVNIPLVGAKLEKLVVDLLEEALVTEERVGRAWLSEG